MTKYLHIFSSYIMKLFLIHIWLCTRSRLNFLIYEKNFYFLFYQCSLAVQLSVASSNPSGPAALRSICLAFHLAPMVSWKHGLIIYIDTKAKCRHLKIWTCKRTLRQVFIRIYTANWRYSQSRGIFDPALWTVAPLTFSLVLSPPLCKGVGGGVWGSSGPQADKHLPQSPFTGVPRRSGRIGWPPS